MKGQGYESEDRVSITVRIIGAYRQVCISEVAVMMVLLIGDHCAKDQTNV